MLIQTVIVLALVIVVDILIRCTVFKIIGYNSVMLKQEVNNALRECKTLNRHILVNLEFCFK